MKKPKIWKATDDERLLAESGKIYRVGFWVLAAGILLDVLMKAAVYLPAWVGEAGIFPLLGLEGIVLIAALVLCALLAAGRGILTLGADGKAYGCARLLLPRTHCTPHARSKTRWRSHRARPNDGRHAAVRERARKRQQRGRRVRQDGVCA